MDRKNHRAPRGSSGFNLLEVLILLTVLGILIGIAAPSLARSQRRYAAFVAARTLRADVAHARLRAILDAVSVRVVIDTVQASYRLERADSTVLRERALAPGLLLRTTAHGQAILFSARGTSNLYSTTWVAVGGDPGARWYGLRVAPTGAVEER